MHPDFRSSRPLVILLAALALAACGTAPSNPDAGDATPDAGDATPDAGDVTPDAGDATPDAGNNPDPVFHARVFNMTAGTVGGGVFANPPVLYFNNIPSMHLSEYVDVPVGTASLQFGGTALSTVPTADLVAGDRILIGIITYANQPIAKGLVEVAHTDASSRRFDFASAGRPIVAEGAGGNTSIETGGTGSLVVPNTQAELMLGLASGATDFHLSTARVPAGGRGTIVSHEYYYLMGAPGLQVPLLADAQLRALNLSFGLGNDAVFKATTPLGEVTFATDVDNAGSVSASAWVARPVTQLSAGGGTQGGTATLAISGSMEEFYFDTSRPVGILGFGNTATLAVHGEFIDPANSGGAGLSIHGLDANIRFRASLLASNGNVVEWQPTFGAGYVEPLGTVGLVFANGVQPDFRIGFGISNPPNAPQGSPEPTFTLTGVTGTFTTFFYSASGGWRLALVRGDGTLLVVNADT